MSFYTPEQPSIYTTDLSNVWHAQGETCSTPWGSLKLTTNASMAYSLWLDGGQFQDDIRGLELPERARIDIGIIGPQEACALAGIGYGAHRRAESMCFISDPARMQATAALEVAVGVGNYNFDAVSGSTLDGARRDYMALRGLLQGLLVAALNEGARRWHSIDVSELGKTDSEGPAEILGKDDFAGTVALRAVSSLISTYPEPKERPNWPGQS